ncbi:MAG: intradiol ring-cleavage dioxygenase [Acidobacteria bacterium]|nr:intradiol ring-cleavage dioxygenase [Acidobacteriota bacterium]
MEEQLFPNVEAIRQLNLNVLQEARPIELLTRRRLLRRTLLGAAGLPLLLAADVLSASLLAATEDVPETENNYEGPFYKPGAPVRSVLLESGMAGTPLTVTGRVLDTQGRPLKGALLDIWHADHTGEYDNKGFRLRGRLYTDDEGRYTLRTIKPLYYGVPGDMRPSHIHVKASFEKSPILTTQLYFKGDPWNHHDPGVRPSLIVSPRKESDGLAAQFDFVIKVS